jgi:ketosteroid isomerase-like protein
MSQENVEVVRGGFDAFLRGDIDAVLDIASDDLVVYRPDPDGAYFHGKEGFLQAFADWTEGLAEWTATPGEIIDGGDTVVARVTQTARGSGSGVPVTGEFWFVYILREGKVTRLEFHVDRAAAFEAAGLSE